MVKCRSLVQEEGSAMLSNAGLGLTQEAVIRSWWLVDTVASGLLRNVIQNGGFSPHFSGSRKRRRVHKSPAILIVRDEVPPKLELFYLSK